MGFLQTLTDVVDFANELKRGYSIGQLIGMDRNGAGQVLTDVVQRSTPQQLDQFEATFLNAAMGMITPAQRIRAMELYAYLKLLEYTHYGQQWRGFATDGRALS